MYYDRTQREGLPVDEDRDTFDIDLQHRFSAGERQELIWGMGYRVTHDEIDDSFTMRFIDDSRLDNLWSAFVQDDITLFPERLRLTLGSKIEHNDYTGLEIQPNARVLWTPHQQHTLWAAVSRAVRTPSRAESDARGNPLVIPPGSRFPGSPLALLSIFGNPDLSSEKLIAYELGYRVQPARSLFLDLALFYNDYDEIVSVVGGLPQHELDPPPPHWVVPFTAENSVAGESYGAELAMDWHVLNWWRLQLAYAFLEIHLHSDDDNELWEIVAKSGTSPEHQCSLRSSLDLTRSLQFDLWLRYVDRLPQLDVDAYVTMDARLAWKPTSKLEIALVGQNLFEDHHAEFWTQISLPSEVQRGVYGKITWQF
jgi:iron complex outermembrane receptor protein